MGRRRWCARSSARSRSETSRISLCGRSFSGTCRLCALDEGTAHGRSSCAFACDYTGRAQTSRRDRARVSPLSGRQRKPNRRLKPTGVFARRPTGSGRSGARRTVPAPLAERRYRRKRARLAALDGPDRCFARRIARAHGLHAGPAPTRPATAAMDARRILAPTSAHRAARRVEIANDASPPARAGIRTPPASSACLGGDFAATARDGGLAGREATKSNKRRRTGAPSLARDRG